MGKDMNIKPENEDYQFMRETIKKKDLTIAGACSERA